jgi:hypothetical protein
MKIIITAFIVMLIASCSFTNEYYQVFKAKTENSVIANEKIVFEDINCTVTYNLWSNGGDIGFNIYNKTNNDIIVDLTKTFFIINGMASEYFQNRSTSKSINSLSAITSYNYPIYYYRNLNSLSISEASSTSYSTSYIEKPQLTIPPKTFINITGFRITESRYINCDLVKAPTKNTLKTLKFEKSNSPFFFYNIITYYLNQDTTKFENRFFVSEVTNYPKDEMFTKVDTSICGRKLDFSETLFKNVSPDKFYYRYKILK